MYYFVFYFIYRLQMKQSDFTPFLGRYMASAIVSFAVIIQIGFVWALARFIFFNYFGIDLFTLTIPPGINFITGIPSILLIMFIIFKYFNNKRISFIIEKYRTRKIYSFINILRVFFIIFIPLIIGIILVNHSIIKLGGS